MLQYIQSTFRVHSEGISVQNGLRQGCCMHGSSAVQPVDLFGNGEVNG